MKDTLLSLQNIRKSFGATRALNGVSIDVSAGEIHAILGQNGAGKSTLVNILDSVISDFEGEIFYKGKRIPHREMQEFFRNKLGVVHQEFPLVPQLSVAENIYLGELPVNAVGIINWKDVETRARALLDSLRIDISPNALIKNLSTGQRQLISIARAMAKEPEILVFDEATSTLTEREVKTVFSLLADLKDKGTGIIFISHKIEEITEISDRVSILRDGISAASKTTKEITRKEMIKLMAGRDVSNQFPERISLKGEEILRVENLSGSEFRNCSFHVNSGEVLGVAGLVGSGRPELLKTIFGALKPAGGDIYLKTERLNIRKPLDAINNDIYFVPSDRLKECVFKDMSVEDNLTIAMIRRYCTFGKIDHKKELKVTSEYIEKLSIKTTGPDQLMKNLSGGNQQKVIISRWLSGKGRVFLFDEPTRGLDVGVKYDVYKLINEIKESGGAIVMISSELPELLAMSDRVVVMYEGALVAQFDNEGLTQETVLAAMMNQSKAVAENFGGNNEHK